MTSLVGHCHCGACAWRYRGMPDHVTACNCTLCRSYATLWAYGYEGEEITVTGEMRRYVRHDRADPPAIAILFCETCGNAICWRGLAATEDGRVRVAVNVRLADPGTVTDLPVRFLDGINDGAAADVRGTARALLY